jgi:hypothetical protein
MKCTVIAASDSQEWTSQSLNSGSKFQDDIELELFF